MTNIASFEAGQQELSAALQRLSSVSTNIKTAPVLSHVLVGASADNTVKLTATDLETCAITMIDAAVEKPGAFTMPAALARSFVNKLPRDSLVYAACDVENRISLEFENFVSRPNALDVADITVSGDAMQQAISKVLPFIPTQEAQYYLNGVYLHSVDGKLTAVATDGKCFAKAFIDLPASVTSVPGVIIPRAAISNIQKLCGAGDDLKIQISETKIRFSIDRSSITSKVIDAKYPDYGRIIPTGNNAHASEDRESSHQQPTELQRSHLIRFAALLSRSATTR